MSTPTVVKQASINSKQLQVARVNCIATVNDSRRDIPTIDGRDVSSVIDDFCVYLRRARDTLPADLLATYKKAKESPNRLFSKAELIAQFNLAT